MKTSSALRPRQRLDKYRIERRLAQGGFADVYQAYDTVEGIRVALKVPQADMLTPAVLEDFRKEVRLTAALDHPHVLQIKNAAFIGRHFVVVYRLGEGTLEERLKKRLSLTGAFDFAEQLLDALAFAHSKNVLHCDVKPENLILFSGSHLRLADFGLAKLSRRTMQASGSGTLGYMAPEQAMGRPSARSDVFAAGLVLWRMFVGTLPAWPYEWPPPGIDRARRKLHPDLIAFLRRSMQLDPRKRFADAGQMLDALQALRGRALSFGQRKQRKRTDSRHDWREVRLRQFKRKYNRVLATEHVCRRCEAPVAEHMIACPWCGASRKIHREETRFPAQCPRCKRGVKLDWRYCPWCYGAGIGPLSERTYSDKRYTARCPSKSCGRRDLMPFMRYCPWCRTKVRRPWTFAGAKERCGKCRWGVLAEYWKNCPWCATTVGSGKR